jgi:hypothetical protein
VTTPTSHGSLPTQWLETHSGTGASGVVSVSQANWCWHFRERAPDSCGSAVGHWVGARGGVHAHAHAHAHGRLQRCSLPNTNRLQLAGDEAVDLADHLNPIGSCQQGPSPLPRTLFASLTTDCILCWCSGRCTGLLSVDLDFLEPPPACRLETTAVCFRCGCTSRCCCQRIYWPLSSYPFWDATTMNAS